MAALTNWVGGGEGCRDAQAATHTQCREVEASTRNAGCIYPSRLVALPTEWQSHWSQ